MIQPVRDAPARTFADLVTLEYGDRREELCATDYECENQAGNQVVAKRREVQPLDGRQESLPCGEITSAMPPTTQDIEENSASHRAKARGNFALPRSPR